MGLGGDSWKLPGGLYHEIDYGKHVSQHFPIKGMMFYDQETVQQRKIKNQNFHFFMIFSDFSKFDGFGGFGRDPGENGTFVVRKLKLTVLGAQMELCEPPQHSTCPY